jgi:lambda family phage minor tail protein L
MTTIQQEGNLLNPDAYMEFFDFDATAIGGTIYYYTNCSAGGTTPIVWRGNSYYPLPIEVTGYDNKADGTAPSRPQLTLSNVNKFLMAAVLSLGDLVGMKVTRWRTFYKFTDAGSAPNTSAYFPIEEHYIVKKLPSSIKTNLSFELAGPLDRPGLQLPRRQILRDLGFPGVSRVRVR